MMSENPEYQTIRENVGTIAQAIASQPSGPTWFEDHLYQQNFTATRGSLPASMTPYDKASQLLQTVETRVTAPYLDTAAEFRKFVNILKRNVAFKELAEHLEREYCKRWCRSFITRASIHRVFISFVMQASTLNAHKSILPVPVLTRILHLPVRQMVVLLILFGS